MSEEEDEEEINMSFDLVISEDLRVIGIENLKIYKQTKRLDQFLK